MAGFRQRIRIGDVLVGAGLITDEQLNNALEEQKNKPKGTRIGRLLVEMGYVQEEAMVLELHKHLQVEYVDLRKIEIDEKAVHLITEPVARKYSLIPIGFIDANTIKVAMADPQDFETIDDLSIITGLNIEPMIALTSQIEAQLDKFYGKQQANAIAEQFMKEQECYPPSSAGEKPRFRGENHIF